MKDNLKSILRFVLFVGWMALFLQACMSDSGWVVFGALLLLVPLQALCIWLGDEPSGKSEEPRTSPFDVE